MNSALTGGSRTSSRPPPESRHAQRACARSSQVVTIQRRPVEPEEPTGIVPSPAAWIAPIARDAGNTRDGPYGHPAAAVPLEPHGHPNPGGPGAGDACPQVDDGLSRNAADS